jgi:glycosyltransferase involved in cell wall biosynthesis
MTLAVSVVVPTYRRAALLQRCLEALLAQDIDPTAYEVIVVDDAACEQTRQLVARVAQEHCAVKRGIPVCYLPVTGAHGPAAARNVGWHAAQGWLIAFTDDDCVPDPGWLRAGLQACADGIAGAWGRIVVTLPPTPTDYERNEAGLERAEFVTANCFYRRDVLQAVGGFDERFRTAWREDSDLFFRLLERSERLVRAADAVVVHPVRPAPWGVSLGLQRKSMYNALLYKKYPALYRRYIQAAPPWHYYRTVAVLLVALGAFFGGRRRLALIAASIWLMLTGRFCAQRLHGSSHALPHVIEMIATSALIPPLSLWWRLRGAVKYRVFFL